MENINETNSEVEELSEHYDSTASEQSTKVEPTEIKEKAKTEKHSSGIIKAGIALTLASSVLSLGASCFSVIQSNKNNTPTAEHTAGNVSTQTTVAISEDGYWIINGTKTNIKAVGTNGTNGEDGKTPYIGENGNWFVGETDTGVKAEGVDGEDGENGENGTDGEDGEDGFSVVSATVVPNDRWNISTYIMFELSNGSFIATNPQVQVSNNHYYDAQTAEEITTLVETYGVSKIKLANDIEISESATFASNIDFDLNRKTLTFSASSPLVVEDDVVIGFRNGSLELQTNKAIVVEGTNAVLELENLDVITYGTAVEIVGEDDSIKLENVNVVVETPAATFSTRRTTTPSLFVVKGANASIEVKETIIKSTSTIVSAEDTAQNFAIDIQKSELETTSAILDVNTDVVQTKVTVDENTMQNSTAASLNTELITSGSFNFNPTEMHLTAEGYDSFNVNGEWIVANSLNTLVTIIEDGSTLVLNKNITLQTYLKVEKTLTIDLNGHNIDRVNSNQTIAVYEGGDLTIEGEGTINGKGAVSGSIAIFAYGGNVTINGGTYTNVCESSDDHDDLIYASNGGHIVINDGTFICQTPAWTLNLYDGDRDISSITVYGGRFYGVDPANNAAEGKGTNFVADGYVVVEKDGMFTLEESFEDAVKDANVSSISLTKNVVLTETLNIDRDLKINLGGHTITSSVKALNIVDGNVTIDNGTISATGAHALYVDGTTTGSDISLTLGSKLTVNSDNCAIFIKGAGAKLVTSATLYANGQFATISGNGNPGNEVNSISIVGGNVTHVSYIAIYVPQTGVFNISGGEITGTSALYVKSGTLNISGGKLTATSEHEDYVYSGNGAHFAGDALIIDACGYPGGNPVVNITGGTFEATDTNAHGIAYYSYNGNTATISASKYEIATHAIVLTEEQLISAIANESVSYIALAKNITLSNTLNINRDLTLNLGGYTITSSVKALNIVDGNVTIDNGTISATGAHALYVDGTTTGSDISLTLGSKLTVNSDNCAIFIKGAGAKLVTSATLYANGQFATISGNGNPGNEVNSISIVGGNVTHVSYIAIYVPQTGVFNISGGEITGTSALYVKSGTLNISGGKLTATGEHEDYVYSGNGAHFAGDALIIDACGYPGGNPVVNITGGTFEATDSNAYGIAYYSYNGNVAVINANGYEVATFEVGSSK